MRRSQLRVGDLTLHMLLRRSFTSLQVRSQVAYGSVGEVDRFEKLVGVKAMAALEEA